MSNGQYTPPQYPLIPGQAPQQGQQQSGQLPSNTGQQSGFAGGPSNVSQGNHPGNFPPGAAPPGSFPGASSPQYPQPFSNPSGQVPAYHLPDESLVAQAYQAHKLETASWGQGGDRPQYVKWPGPQGQLKWDGSVPPGYEVSLYVYILPPWAPGKNIFKTVRSHFWKSFQNPMGTSIGCPGNDTCLICQAREAGMSHPDPRVQDRAKNFGKVRTQHLYNVVLLDNPNGHWGQDGRMHPFILGAGAFLHKAIGDIIDDKQGAINVVDPTRGRPLRLKRAKTGPNEMNVQYSAIAQDPAPLPTVFYPCLQAIHDLDAQDRQPSMGEMMKAVQEMGLPLPPGMSSSGYQAAPIPPGSSPYSMGQPQVGNPSAPMYMPPPADPYEFPPRDVAFGPGPGPGPGPGFNPMAGSGPMQSSPWSVTGSPVGGGVPPPPLVSTPQETNYMAQPGRNAAPQSPSQASSISPSPHDAPLGNTCGDTPPTGGDGKTTPVGIPTPPPVNPFLPSQSQVSAGLSAPSPSPSSPSPSNVSSGVPPCFGRYNSGDRTCASCVDQIRGACIAQSGQVSSSQSQEPQVSQDLAQLQRQLSGGQV